jgi:hypothetical protein
MTDDDSSVKNTAIRYLPIKKEVYELVSCENCVPDNLR